MKGLKHYSIVLFISFLLFLIIINIFNPIFTAKELFFPYSITKFDIVSKFPRTWFYLKLIYLISCFFNIFLIINSISKFFIIRKIKVKKEKNVEENIDSKNINLLLGINSITQNKVIIPEKGLYQNILITGTIGSRKDRFLYVSYLTPTN